MHTLLQEIKQFGEFSSQFYALESFRQELKPFYQWKLLDKFVGFRGKKSTEIS